MSTRNGARNRWVVSLLDIQPADVVLEIGFGTGLAIRYMARKVTTGRIVGIDHSDLMVDTATRRNARAVVAGRVIPQTGSADDLPRFEQPFDKVLSVNSYAFWRTPADTLARLRSAMRPGGLLAIAHQPRHAGATDASALIAGQHIVEQLRVAGFNNARLEMNTIKPVMVACALANA